MVKKFIRINVTLGWLWPCFLNVTISPLIDVCVCVCVCVEREREREREIGGFTCKLGWSEDHLDL